jgi:hypothetical protein
MVTVVVIVNFAIALTLLYIAYRICQIRQQLARIANTLIAVERNTQAVLRGAPDAIIISQVSIRRLRQGNEPLQLQLQRVRRVLSLLVFGRQVWQRFSWSPTLKQPLTKYKKRQLNV